ncbi:hypothetical protein QTI24_20950 [Variovorax sp. J22P240]|uniref:hypothetical protein n=1 Tax=Variovorax sp. J22P240 TaxID=3053514 RepID=UPI00257671E7|nr:hypothetical protein [Variovorax sp. J22P240]MDM0001089.1 hypothetical protein [Variovorax sp. J22P240]
MQQTQAFSNRPFRGDVMAAPEGRGLGMNDYATHNLTAPRPSHQLYFASLLDPDLALSFPCNRCGEVQLDELSERARNNYFLARTAEKLGRDFGPPMVIALDNGSIH